MPDTAWTETLIYIHKEGSFFRDKYLMFYGFIPVAYVLPLQWRAKMLTYYETINS